MKKIFFLLLITMSLNLKAGIKENLIQSSDLLALNKLHEAEIILEKTIKIKPRDEEEKRSLELAYYNLGVINYEFKRYDKAKMYFKLIYNKMKSNTVFPIYSNLYLIDIAMNENKIDDAISYAEHLNMKTNFKEIEFLAYLYYLYYEYSFDRKLEDLYKQHLNILSEKDKYTLYTKVANMYTSVKKYDNAKKFYTKLINSKKDEFIQYGYIGLARVDTLNKKYSELLENINKALKSTKKMDVSILKEIEEILLLNNDYENLLNFLKIHYNLIKDDINVLISLIKITKELNKEEELKYYLKEFDNLKISNFDKGIRLGLENLVEYAETYLNKAKQEGNEKVDEFLLNLYYGLKDENKLLMHLEKMEKDKKMDKNQRDEILNEFYQYKKFSKGNNVN